MAPKGKRTKITGGIKYDPLIDTAWSKNMPLHLFDTKEKITADAIEASPTMAKEGLFEKIPQWWEGDPVIGTPPEGYPRGLVLFQDYGYGKSPERIQQRKFAAENKFNQKFLNELLELTPIKQEKSGGKSSFTTKYSEDFIGDWIEITKDPASREYVVQGLKEKFPQNNIIQQLDKRARKMDPDYSFYQGSPLFESYNYFKAKKPIVDDAIMIGLQNLVSYAKEHGGTGRHLKGQDLKDVIWPGKENQKYHGLWKNSDDFTAMITNVFKKNYNHLFPEGFDQYASVTSKKTPIAEQISPLTNKNYAEIAPVIEAKTGTKEPKLYDFAGDAEIIGQKNIELISNIIGRGHHAARNMEGAHPNIHTSIKNQVNSLINRYLMEGFKQNKKATINSMMKNVNEKMNNPYFASRLVDLLNKRTYYEEYLGMAKKMTGVEGVKDIDLSGLPQSLDIAHKTALRDYYKLGIEIDNLFLMDMKANRAAASLGWNITKAQRNLKKTRNPNERVALQNKIDLEIQKAKEANVIGNFEGISIGKVKNDLKILTDRMEDHFYQVMGRNRGGIIKPQHIQSSLASVDEVLNGI